MQIGAKKDLQFCAIVPYYGGYVTSKITFPKQA
jgi:hypothetical protein